tara:strand:+ start:868 stop:1242 length:375 start_codon:yes stop_codon:yes gene_type:complete
MNWWKVIFLLSCVMGVSMSPLNAMEIKASQLISSCSSAKNDEQAFCIGYIGGIIDGARTQKELAAKMVFRHSLTGKIWCGSKEQNLINATNKVVEFFQEGKISHYTSALMLVISALENKWPCKN